MDGPFAVLLAVEEQQAATQVHLEKIRVVRIALRQYRDLLLKSGACLVGFSPVPRSLLVVIEVIAGRQIAFDAHQLERGDI